MTAQEHLRHAIDAQQQRLRASVPADRAISITALVHAIDQMARAFDQTPQPDLIFWRRPAALGGNTALQLCLEAVPSAGSDADPAAWASNFLVACCNVAEAEQVIVHCETGFMRAAERNDGDVDAWIATRRPPTSWHERADFDWWGAFTARKQADELRRLTAATRAAPGDDANDRQLANLYVSMMTHQFGYPPDATIAGCTIRMYCDVLAQLIALVRAERDRGESPSPQSERALAATIATVVPAGPNTVAQILAAFTLDAENAAYHAAVPGVAAAPLVRLEADLLVWSLHGLTSEPMLFLMRELRRRAAQEYHDSAHLREGVFRDDLYALFEDKRFVTSANRIELRRDSGNVRTDIDAIIFDRKTGTLAFFELKSQDPFARSTAELHRQRDNLLYANRQVSGVLAWLNRSGAAADLLNRVDQRTAKTFRVQKCYPFVLGRYLAHFTDGPEPDRRAAWGTWPQLLRLLDGQPATGANPLASLFNRLSKDVPQLTLATDLSSHAIAIGDKRLVVHPSYAVFQECASD